MAKNYVYECDRCGKQQKSANPPEGDRICPRCGDLMGTLTERQQQGSENVCNHRMD